MNVLSNTQREKTKSWFAQCLEGWDVAQTDVVERNLAARAVVGTLDEFFLVMELHAMAVERKAALTAQSPLGAAGKKVHAFHPVKGRVKFTVETGLPREGESLDESLEDIAKLLSVAQEEIQTATTEAAPGGGATVHETLVLILRELRQHNSQQQLLLDEVKWVASRGMPTYQAGL
jgi:hypothetical protein